jgi:hypothetical protein
MARLLVLVLWMLLGASAVSTWYLFCWVANPNFESLRFCPDLDWPGALVEKPLQSLLICLGGWFFGRCWMTKVKRTSGEHCCDRPIEDLCWTVTKDHGWHLCLLWQMVKSEVFPPLTHLCTRTRDLLSTRPRKLLFSFSKGACKRSVDLLFHFFQWHPGLGPIEAADSKKQLHIGKVFTEYGKYPVIGRFQCCTGIYQLEHSRVSHSASRTTLLSPMNAQGLQSLSQPDYTPFSHERSRVTVTQPAELHSFHP